MPGDIQNDSIESFSSEKNSTEWVDMFLIKKIGDKEEKIDIMSIFIGIALKESIYSKTVTGVISISDPNSSFKEIRINGGEKITFTLISNLSGVTYDFEYEVIAVDYSYNPEDPAGIVQLTFEDPAYKYLTKEYSTSFKEEKISSFVSRFSEENLKKEVEVEETDEKLSFSFPYQKFHYILSYLNQYAISQKEYRGYTYFSTLRGTHYKTMSGMMEKDYVEYLKQVEPTLATGTNKFVFADYKKSSSINTLDVLMGKGFKSEAHYFDSETKDIVVDEYTYSNTLDREVSLGKYGKYSTDFEDENKNVYYASTKNTKNDMMIMDGISKSADKVEITFDYGVFERSVGNVYKIDFLDFSIKDEDKDISMSGMYLCTEITHVFDPGHLKQKMVFVRNADMSQMNDQQKTIPISKRGSLGRVNKNITT
jgi:hypothetical protein